MKEMKIPKEYLEAVFILAIGAMTLKEIEKEGVYVTYVGSNETEAGVISLLETLDLEGSTLLLPQSSMTRPKLIHYLVEKGIAYEVIILYDLLKEKPYTKLNLEEFDALIFTSPVGVEAFFEVYEDIIPSMEIHTMGLMTRCTLKKCLDKKAKKNEVNQWV
jgi:uroporphyrinogen-III synthase